VKLPFTSLNPQEALHVAIFIEERNAELYHRFGEMFVEFRDSESLEIASVFWEMAAEEKKHSSQLQEKYTERYGTSGCSLTEEDLIDMIEVPRLESGDVFGSENERDKTSVRERALRVALHAEQNAQQFYLDLFRTTVKGPLRDLYLELAHMEDTHVAFIAGKLAPSSAVNGKTTAS